MQTEDVLYQVEIKNSSAHALHGKPLRLDATADESEAYRVARWNEIWKDGTFTDPRIGKVLVPMKPPHEHPRIEPLLAVWMAMHPAGVAVPFFSVPVTQPSVFQNVNVFSMSNYLRSLDSDTLVLDMPNTCARVRWLGALLDVP